MPRFTLLRQDRTIITPPGHSGEFSSVKVAFPPIRDPQGNPLTVDALDGEDALLYFRTVYPELKEILLAVEPTNKSHYGNRESRVH